MDRHPNVTPLNWRLITHQMTPIVLKSQAEMLIDGLGGVADQMDVRRMDAESALWYLKEGVIGLDDITVTPQGVSVRPPRPSAAPQPAPSNGTSAPDRARAIADQVAQEVQAKVSAEKK